MNLSISHIAGVCLDTLRFINRPSTYIGTVFFLAFLKIVFILLKTFLYRRKLITQKAPKSVLKLIVKHGLAGKFKIIFDKKPLAFCLGFFHPKIYLSTGLLKLMSDQELEIIILHEKYHLMKKDNISLVIINSLKQLFFLFPILPDFLDNLLKFREIKADRYSLSLTGKNQSLVSTFKKLLNFNVDPSFLFSYSSTFTNHQHFETRIHAIFGKKSFHFTFKLKNILISFVSFVVFTSFFFSPWNVSRANSQTKTPLFCLKNTDCSKHC